MDASLVVAWLSSFGKLLQDTPERGHTLSDVALLVLRNGTLDVSKDEIVVERGRLVVVGNCLFEILHDKVDWRKVSVVH